jgi:glycosyltransferase involved in cell wall biosynthesis
MHPDQGALARLMTAKIEESGPPANGPFSPNPPKHSELSRVTSAIIGELPETHDEVVLVCQLFYPELVSTGQTLTELVEELSALGLKLTVIAAQPTLLPGTPCVPSVIDYAGVIVRRTWSTRFRKTSFLGKLLNLTSYFVTATWTIFRQHRNCQLLLLTNPPYLPLLGWLLHALRKQRFGVLLFDIMPEQAELINFIRPGGFVARLWCSFNRLWYRRAAYVIVLSRDMLEGALRNASLLGSSEESDARKRTHVISVWSDDRMIEPKEKAESSEARRLGITGKFVVQYSGNHGRFHDIESLLEIARLLNDRTDIVFQFIGEGQKKHLVRDYQSRYRLKNIYESTYCPKELLGDSLAMADLGVVAQLPGQERVCYPSKSLGIMAAGRATLAICPPECELARLIKEQELGFVVPNQDAVQGAAIIAEAASQPERVAAMGSKAHEYVRAHFSLKLAASKYFKLIQSNQPTINHE